MHGIPWKLVACTWERSPSERLWGQANNCNSGRVSVFLKAKSKLIINFLIQFAFLLWMLYHADCQSCPMMLIQSREWEKQDFFVLFKMYIKSFVNFKQHFPLKYASPSSTAHWSERYNKSFSHFKLMIVLNTVVATRLKKRSGIIKWNLKETFFFFFWKMK